MLKFRLHKKAVVSPVFKYIFVMIAGAILLTFFVVFAQRITKQETKVIDVSVLYSLDASLQAFSVSGDSYSPIPQTPWSSNINIRFGTKVNCGQFTVGQRQYVPIEKVIFGPSLLSGRQLQAWTLAWKFPFRITNLFYFTNPKNKYYLVYGSDNQEFVEGLSSDSPRKTGHLPEKFNIKPLPKRGVTQKSKEIETYDLVKFVSFEDMVVPQGAKGSVIDARNCGDENEDYECHGTVRFSDGKQYTFVGKEMLFGAILADDSDVYECQYLYALDELERMIKLYKTKVTKLKEKKIDCPEYSNLLTDLFVKMEYHIAALKSDPKSIANAQSLTNYAREIEEYNENVLDGKAGCEIIY